MCYLVTRNIDNEGQYYNLKNKNLPKQNIYSLSYRILCHKLYSWVISQIVKRLHPWLTDYKRIIQRQFCRWYFDLYMAIKRLCCEIFRWKVPFVYFELWFVYLYTKFPGQRWYLIYVSDPDVQSSYCIIFGCTPSCNSIRDPVIIMMIICSQLYTFSSYSDFTKKKEMELLYANDLFIFISELLYQNGQEFSDIMYRLFMFNKTGLF